MSQFDLKGALKRALGGGLSGAAAMVLQVLLLMPIRTIMNYQYRHGTSLTVATKTLYQDGGYGRYYAGMGAALFQGEPKFSKLHEACLVDHFLRTHCTVRRHSSQCWYSGAFAIQWISSKSAFTHQDHLRITVCCGFQNDTHSNRHLKDHLASRRVTWNHASPPAYQDQRYQQPLVGCLRNSCRNVRWPLPVVCNLQPAI